MSKYNKLRRFIKACEYNKIETDSILKLIGAVERRAKSDREVEQAFRHILNIMEPTVCPVEHCPDHSRYDFCNCRLSYVPGNCPIVKKYKAGRIKEAQKTYNEGYARGVNANIRKVTAKYTALRRSWYVTGANHAIAGHPKQQALYVDNGIVWKPVPGMIDE